ncbi:MAG TPA: autotransporter-associated beta strand repeat-containing protein, partial [Verrucomicrobiae bacterium]|nr:autotransporter-associated beta strand repeat-containing protein [Verrucomicrobiae bacterium]
MLALSLATSRAQTASWTGAGGDTSWNNALNWDLGTPAEGTNAFITSGIIVDYNSPMAATSFAGVNNFGTLNISAPGFNIDAGELPAYATAALGYLRVDSAGVFVATNSSTIAFPTDSAVSVEGGTLIITNSTGNITFGQNGNNAGAGFTNNGGTVIFSQPFQSRGRFSRFAMNGGTLSFLGGGGIFEGSNDQERQFLINGGTAYLGDFAIGRTLNTVGSAGLVISNGNVTTSSLIVGNGIAAGGATVFGGTLTNTGTFLIADRTNAATTGQRRIFFYVRGGTVVSTAASGIVVANRPNNNAAGGSSIWGGFLDINSGLLVAEKITLVSPDALTNAHATLTLAGSGEIYLGSGGLVGNVGYSNTSYTMTFNGGTLGAKDDFSIVGNGTLGGTFTVKAADLANTPRNITLNGVWSGAGALVKTGGGLLTLNAANTYNGSTTISEGTLALGAGGALANSPQINVASGAVFDVSAVAPYTLGSGKVLQGVGTVSGSVVASSGATIRPAGAGTVGVLTFAGGLTQNGGVINAIEFGSVTNDVIEVIGDLSLNPTATNTIVISSSGGAISAGTYTLLHYSGTLVGGTTDNFELSGIAGTIVHNATAKTISLVTSGLRAPTSVFWVGAGGGGNWDAVASLNWNDGAPNAYFVNGDTVRFDANGAANPAVNLTEAVAPASVTVDAATAYSFGGVGSIGGTGGLTKTNTGTLTISTTNSYTGATAINGGVVAVTTLANGAFNSGIGAASASAANLVLDGGTLRYLGGNVSTDRGATLNENGGTIEVATGGVTLTANGALTGIGSLTKQGAGSLVLTVANTYTNGTVINSGTLQLNNAASAGTGGLTNHGATLRVNGALVVDNAVHFTGVSTVELSGVGGGNIALRGSWSGDADVLVNFLTQNAGQTFTMGGSGGAGGGHMWDFSGTIDFGTNTGFARFNNNATSVNLGSSNATFNLGTGNLVLSQRNGNTTTHLGALIGGPNTWLSGRRGDVAGVCTYSIGGNNLSTTFEGIITNGVNEAAIIKVGSGTLRLTGNSPYTGATTVESGTLQVDGEISASPITVNAGALTGNGTLGGAINIFPNGLLSPGTSIGRLTMSGSLTMFSTSTNLMEIHKAAATNDSIVGLQFVSYGGTLVVSNLGGTLAEGDAFKLFDATPGAYFGAFEFMELPALGPDLYWDTSGLVVDGTIRVYKPRPSIQSFGIDGNQFFLTGTNGGNTS